MPLNYISPSEPDDMWSSKFEAGPINEYEVIVDEDTLYATIEVKVPTVRVRVKSTHIQLWFGDDGLCELNYPKGVQVDPATAKCTIKNGVIDIVAKTVRRKRLLS